MSRPQEQMRDMTESPHFPSLNAIIISEHFLIQSIYLSQLFLWEGAMTDGNGMIMGMAPLFVSVHLITLKIDPQMSIPSTVSHKTTESRF